MRCRVGTAFAVGAVLLALNGCGSGAEPQAEQACGKAVLADWTDGRIDRTYPGPCYLAAIDGLPEDVRAYTTAKYDISRALYSRRADS
jgi:hypothetical protein